MDGAMDLEKLVNVKIRPVIINLDEDDEVMIRHSYIIRNC